MSDKGFELPLNISHLTQRVVARLRISHNDMTTARLDA